MLSWSGRETALAALRYTLRKAYVDRRYKSRRPRGTLVTPGVVKGHTPHERGIVVQTANGAIRLSVLAPDLIQVRVLPNPNAKFNVPFSYATAKVTWADVRFSVTENDQMIMLSAPDIVCRINRADGTLTFLNGRGQVISHDTLAWRTDEVRLTRDLPTGELCLGLGAQPTSLDLRGRRYISWNHDPVGTSRDKIPTYYTIPFYLGAHRDYTYGIFWDNSSRGFIDIGKENKEQQVFSAWSGELRYYVISGGDSNAVNTVLNRYTELTGRMTLPPLWALGFHISRWSYSPAEKVREVAKELRTRNIPCDVIYLDIDYMDGYRVFTWNLEKFPAPAVLIKDLADQGFKVIPILDPGIKADPKYSVYKSGLAEDVFVKYPSGKVFKGPVWAGESVFPDFTNPKARAWWAGHVAELLKTGVAGIWNDMNEPTVFNLNPDTYMPEAVKHDMEGQRLSHVEGRNVYGMLMGRASYDALVKMRPNKRPVNMIRAAWAGTQRYASTWTGDNRSDWDHLKLAITMVLNSGLSGLAFNGPDVGGFFGDTEPELYARFMQIGSMMPYFREHTAHGTIPQEPYAFGKEIEEISRKFIELRYQLLPYFYATFAQCAQHGYPIVRPLFTVDPSDDALRKIDDAFMVGDALLVAPVVEKGKTEREVYLPRGRWFDYFTGKAYTGGQTVKVSAPLDSLPIFGRAGQVIPLYPVQQFVGQQKITELRLKIFAGNGEVTLYEDAGEGLEYTNGVYRWLYFTVRIAGNGEVSIDWRQAGNFVPPYQQVRCEVYGVDFEPSNVQVDNSAAPLWYFEKGIVEFTANKPFATARIVR
jgi:alpha-glucosidase